MPVFLTGTLNCQTADEAARVRRALPEHMRLTRAEPGCVRFDVSETDDPLVWRVDEEFVDRQAFDAHTARAQASDWGRQSAGIARQYKVTEAP